MDRTPYATHGTTVSPYCFNSKRYNYYINFTYFCRPLGLKTVSLIKMIHRFFHSVFLCSQTDSPATLRTLETEKATATVCVCVCECECACVCFLGFFCLLFFFQFRQRMEVLEERSSCIRFFSAPSWRLRLLTKFLFYFLFAPTAFDKVPFLFSIRAHSF